MAKRRNHRSGQRSNKTTLSKVESKRASHPSSLPQRSNKPSMPHGASKPAMQERASKPAMQSRASKPSLPQAAVVVGFTELEEAFFAAGESEPHLEKVAAAQSEVDAEHSRPSLWKRLFARAA